MRISPNMPKYPTANKFSFFLMSMFHRLHCFRLIIALFGVHFLCLFSVHSVQAQIKPDIRRVDIGKIYAYAFCDAHSFVTLQPELSSFGRAKRGIIVLHKLDDKRKTWSTLRQASVDLEGLNISSSQQSCDSMRLLFGIKFDKEVRFYNFSTGKYFTLTPVESRFDIDTIVALGSPTIHSPFYYYVRLGFRKDCIMPARIGAPIIGVKTIASGMSEFSISLLHATERWCDPGADYYIGVLETQGLLLFRTHENTTGRMVAVLREDSKTNTLHQGPWLPVDDAPGDQCPAQAALALKLALRNDVGVQRCHLTAEKACCMPEQAAPSQSKAQASVIKQYALPNFSGTCVYRGWTNRPADSSTESTCSGGVVEKGIVNSSISFRWALVTDRQWDNATRNLTLLTID